MSLSHHAESRSRSRRRRAAFNPPAVESPEVTVSDREWG
jgi:hypothetical protein